MTADAETIPRLPSGRKPPIQLQRRLLGEPLRRLQGPPRLHRRRLRHDDVRHRPQLEGEHGGQRGLQSLHPSLLRRRPDLDHPASQFAHINGNHPTIGDGTTTCEDYGWGGQVEEEFCTDYGPGDFEQARNVSRLTGSKVTVLDPRYSPTGGMLKKDYTNLLCDDDLDGIWEAAATPSDAQPPIPKIPRPVRLLRHLRDRRQHRGECRYRRYPLDMYYSRATNFGDDWDEQDVCATLIQKMLGIQVPAWIVTKAKPNCAGIGWRMATTGRSRPASTATQTATVSTPSGTRNCRLTWNTNLHRHGYRVPPHLLQLD